MTEEGWLVESSRVSCGLFWNSLHRSAVGETQQEGARKSILLVNSINWKLVKGTENKKRREKGRERVSLPHYSTLN